MYYCIRNFQRIIPRSNKMSGYPTEFLNNQNIHHWSVKLFDRENGLEDRNAHIGPHKERLTEFKKQNPGAIGE
jgi:hypothetical protein